MMPPQAGLEAQALIKVNLAVRSLIEALGILKDVRGETAKAVVDALRGLSKVTPEISESIGQSEIAGMMGNAQAVTQPNPQMRPTMMGTGRPSPMMMR